MKGTVRAKDRCPKCGGAFQLQFVANDPELICPGCLTRSSRPFVDIHHEGERMKLYSDRTGRLFESARHAWRTLEGIRREIDEHAFDRSKYVKREIRDMLVKNQLDDWVKSCKDLKPNSLKIKRRFVNKYIEPELGGMDIRDLRKARVIKYLDGFPLAQTKVTLRAQIQAFLNWAYRDMEIIDRPILLPRYELPEKIPRGLTWPQQQEILALMPKHYHPIIRFIMAYGCRKSEAIALWWDCVDFDKLLMDDAGKVVAKGEILIKRNYSDKVLCTTKEGKEKAVPMTPEIRELLLGLKEKRPKTGKVEPHVFLNLAGRHYTTQLQAAFKKAAIKAGYPQAYLHMNRNSFVMQRLGTFSYEEIGAVLGHRNIKTTMRYGRMQPRQLVKVIGLPSPKVSPNRPQLKKRKAKDK
jgi:integrase